MRGGFISLKENEVLYSSSESIKMKNNDTEATNTKIAKLEMEIQKEKLIDKFFKIGSNVYLEEIIEIEKEFQDFYDKSNDKDIKRLLLVIEMLKTNSRNEQIYELSMDFYHLFSELYHTERMTFFEIRILSIMFIASDEPEEIFLLTNHLLENLENYEDESLYNIVKFFIYQNAADTLLYVRNQVPYNYATLYHDPILVGYLGSALVLAKQLKNQFWIGFIQLRLGLMLEFDFMIRDSIDLLKSLNDAAVDKLLENESKEYNIEKYL